MSGAYEHLLDGTVFMYVAFKTEWRGRDVVDYSVVLVIEVDGRMETVRVYDGAHGENELHRYTRDGVKQAAEVFARGTLGEGMCAAIDEIKRGYEEMIDGWHKHERHQQKRRFPRRAGDGRSDRAEHSRTLALPRQGHLPRRGCALHRQGDPSSCRQ